MFWNEYSQTGELGSYCRLKVHKHSWCQCVSKMTKESCLALSFCTGKTGKVLISKLRDIFLLNVFFLVIFPPFESKRVVDGVQKLVCNTLFIIFLILFHISHEYQLLTIIFLFQRFTVFYFEHELLLLMCHNYLIFLCIFFCAFALCYYLLC